MNSSIKVCSARKILPMNPMQPEATHVAVRDGRLLAVGDADRRRAWGDFELDDCFAGPLLMPGLVEGHANLLASGLWQYVYVGFHERTASDGAEWPGCRSFDEVVARLSKAQSRLGDSVQRLLAWGFDPIFFGAERMTVRHLDRVSRERPIVVLHASLHLMNVNSAALAKAGITRDSELEGIARFADGEPNGELQEFAAMFPIMRLTGNVFHLAGGSETAVRMYGRIAQLAGVTTAVDLANDLSDDMTALLERVTLRRRR